MYEQLNEILLLLRENNMLLKEIANYVRYVQNPETINNKIVENFVLDVMANLTASDILKNRK